MSNSNDDDGFQIIAEKTVPDVYTDSVGFELSVYGITLIIGKVEAGQRPAGQGKPATIPRVRVHMSPQHAKVMAKVFAKTLAEYEGKVGPIPIPKPVLDELGITEEW